MIKVIDSGFLSTFQDMGRVGFSDVGLTHSGAMDEFSYLLANALLGDKEKACIEIVYGKFSFEVLANISISVCAPEGEIEINKKTYPINRTFKLKAGDKVNIKPLKKGNFLYLCVKGGFKAPKKYNSASVSIREGILSPIKNDDILKANTIETVPNRFSLISQGVSEEIELRVVLGYQQEYFEMDKFFKSEFVLTRINRQGAVLKGDIKPKKGDIVSEGLNFGAIQVPSNGNPIILLKEYQTIGGYPKVGSVLPIDCFKLSQHRFAKIRFKEIDLQMAKKEIIDFYAFFKKLHFSFVQMYH